MIDIIFVYGVHDLNGLFTKYNILFMLLVFLCLFIMYLYTKLERMTEVLDTKERSNLSNGGKFTAVNSEEAMKKNIPNKSKE